MSSRSRRLRLPSIRGQLAVLITALGLPLVAFQLWWGYEEYREAEAEAESQALVLADATSASITQFLNLNRQLLQAVVEQYGEAWLVRGRCGDQPATVRDLSPFLIAAYAVRTDGEIVCSSNPVPPGETAVGWHVMERVLTTREFATGDPIEGTLSGRWLLPVGLPVFDDRGAVIGAVIGSIPLLEFDHFLDGVGLDGQQLVTVANGDRVVIARSHEPERWVGQTLPPNQEEDEEIAPGRWVARGTDFYGVPRAWGQVRMASGWIVYVGMPEEAVFQPPLQAFARQLGTTLLVLLAGIALATLSYRRIGASLQELIRRIRRAADGETIPLPEGTPSEVSTVVEQFNETLRSQRRAEAAERSARERYQAIFDNAVFGIYVSTIDGRFLQVNRSLATMLGYDSPEALKEAGAQALYGSPHVREELIEQAFRRGIIDNWEVDWLRADGHPISVRLNGRQLQGPDGEVVFEMIVQDITVERRTEGELRQTQKMEAIGKLAGGIAHDFNNLLTVIGGNLELIDGTLPKDHPVRLDIDQIREAATRASALTSQLLAFARREPHGARPVDVNRVIVEMERLLVRLIGEDVSLETRLSDARPVVAIDPAELQQILMNVVLNARDAMPSGGRVVIETWTELSGDGSPDRTALPDGVWLSVQDTGAGMDEETTKRVFEPFYTTKPMGEGTGLGLSTVYGIVQRAGGHAEIESEPGFGTSLRIWFPLTDEDVPVDVTRPSYSPDGGTETILVVEDEELVRSFVHRALADAGYDVLVASDGQEALDRVRALETSPHMVLTDIVMPRMSGTELADELTALVPETPVLFMSGYVDNQAVSHHFGSKPEILLRKPFSTAELCQRVRLTLDRRLAGRG